MLDPASLLILALATGAAAALEPMVEDAIKSAYFGLKKLIQDRYADAAPAIDVLESDPKKQTNQDAAKKIVAGTDAVKDGEVLEQAQKILKEIEEKAPEIVSKINIDITKITNAANVNLGEWVATGDISFKLGEVSASGDFTLKNLQAGTAKEQTDPKVKR